MCVCKLNAIFVYKSNPMKFHFVKDSSNESNCSLCPSSSNEMNVHKNDIIETVIFQGVFLLFVDFPPIRKLFGYKNIRKYPHYGQITWKYC